jgi:transcription antitermination factor NusG
MTLRHSTPYRRNHKNEYVPLWRSYLFIQFVEGVSIELCRTTSHFIRIISERDDDGLMQPILIRKDAINESLKLMTMGKCDDVVFQRRAYGKGAIVRVIEGNFIDTKVRLEMDVTPDMSGRTKVKVDINGLKATIELFKLAL